MTDAKRITYLDGRRIGRGMRAGALRVMAAQEHLNKINVYPVADGDTGTNLALTMNAVHGAIANNRSRNAAEVLTRIADAALDGARGNSGAIVAQYLQGISDSVAGYARLSVEQFASAVKAGERYARDALAKRRDRPHGHERFFAARQSAGRRWCRTGFRYRHRQRFNASA